MEYCNHFVTDIPWSDYKNWSNSLFKGQGWYHPYQRCFAATPILCVGLLYILGKMPKTNKNLPLNYIIVFLVAGAIGNYIDRIMNHYVVDFIYVSLINFPVFNVADCYVTVSVILLFVLIMFYYKDEDLEELKQHLRFKKNGWI